jgi:hypothetical protein
MYLDTELPTFGNAGSLYSGVTKYKSNILWSICRKLPRCDDWNFYICSQLHSMLSYISDISVFTLPTTLLFLRDEFS